MAGIITGPLEYRLNVGGSSGVQRITGGVISYFAGSLFVHWLDVLRSSMCLLPLAVRVAACTHTGREPSDLERGTGRAGGEGASGVTRAPRADVRERVQVLRVPRARAPR